MRLSASLLALAALSSAPAFAKHQHHRHHHHRSSIPDFDHVFVIMMENTSETSLIGNPHAPWLNQAAAQYGLADQYFGVAHPSQPNYVAAISGALNGVTKDDDITIDAPNLVDQLDDAGRTWTAYMQSMYAGGNTDKLAHAAGNSEYERKHNPFVSFANIQSNPDRMANVVDFSQFDQDLENDEVADFVWISPDQCNDMHGRGGPASDVCSYSHHNDLVTAGDNFLQTTVNKIMNSDAWSRDSVIFIVWDESDFPFVDNGGCCSATPGGGHVLGVTITGDERTVKSEVPYNHYSLLRTVQESWDLGCMANTCNADVVPMFDLVGDDD